MLQKIPIKVYNRLKFLSYIVKQMSTNLIYKNENNKNNRLNRANQSRESKAPNFSKAT
jgi:hypothetical protein